MSSLSELVEDAKLPVTIYPDYVSHRVFDPAVRGEREEKWRRDRFLGRGGFGLVWLERCLTDSDDQKLRAVKMIPRQSASLLTVDFTRELEAMVKFSQRKYERHFVNLLGWYEDLQSTYIIMEYFPLGDLQSHLSQPLPEHEVQHITKQVLGALQHLHVNGFAHRDLKPENIFVAHGGPDWWLKIGDFGISKRVNQGTALRTRVGTPGYLAPEIVEQELYGSDTSRTEYTHAVDIWALGVMTYYMLTKSLPFQQLWDLLACARDGGLPLSTLLEHGVTTGCQDFLQALMDPEASKRPDVQVALRHEWLRSHDIPSKIDGAQKCASGQIVDQKRQIHDSPRQNKDSLETHLEFPSQELSSGVSKSWFGLTDLTEVKLTLHESDTSKPERVPDEKKPLLELSALESTMPGRLTSSPMTSSIPLRAQFQCPQNKERNDPKEERGLPVSNTQFTKGVTLEEDDMYNLGHQHYQLGHYDLAESCFRATFYAQKIKHGLNHELTRISLRMLVRSCVGHLRLRSAEEFMGQLWKAETETLGYAMEPTVETCDALGHALFVLGDYVRAESMARQIFITGHKRRHLHPDYVDISCWNMAACNYRGHQYQSAIGWFSQAYSAQLKELGTSYLRAAFMVGYCQYCARMYSSAAESLHTVYYEQYKILGRGHPDTLLTLQIRAYALCGDGEYETAYEILELLHIAALDALGRDHQWTLRAAANLREPLGTVSYEPDKTLPIPEADPVVTWECIKGQPSE
ncbi:kinase-like domain-containing protein [Aspergillus heterothallicus]